MFHKKGKILPGERPLDAYTYATAIADALRVELGESHRAAKTLVNWTGVSDRTAKNWLHAACGPSGEHLIQLARKSDAVLAALLSLAGRNEHLLGADLTTIKRELESASELVDQLLQGRI
jgi:hypothetical protein